MSRSFPSLSCLQSYLPSSSSSAGPSTLPLSLRSFHTTPPQPVAKKILNARARLATRNRKLDRLARQNAPKPRPNYILGHVDPPAPAPGSPESRLPPAPPLRDPWKGCRLSKILIHPQTIWSLPVPDYAKGEMPKYTLPGLNDDEREILFGALPHVTTALKYNADAPERERDEGIRKVVGDQEKQSEMLARIMDLRNASREVINGVNRGRIIDEFGGGVDTGGSAVQVALLTMKIRGLNEHMLANKKDLKNRRSMNLLIGQRARLLKYVKRTHTPEDYATLLADIGVAPEAVEGELIARL